MKFVGSPELSELATRCYHIFKYELTGGRNEDRKSTTISIQQGQTGREELPVCTVRIIDREGMHDITWHELCVCLVLGKVREAKDHWLGLVKVR